MFFEEPKIIAKPLFGAFIFNTVLKEFPKLTEIHLFSCHGRILVGQTNSNIC